MPPKIESDLWFSYMESICVEDKSSLSEIVGEGKNPYSKSLNRVRKK